MDVPEPQRVELELVVAGAGFDRAAAQARELIAAQLFPAERMLQAARPFQAARPARCLADRYALGAKIGAGGQGSVWRAHDLELDREVAIKALHLADDDAPAREWLRREARMLGRLAHPAVVRVFDVGLGPADLFGGASDDRVALYVVMELVPGLSLDRWLGVRPRSVDEIFAVMGHVALGLQAVHAAGLVHCDVKPSNILVDVGQAKLGDFGLAHAVRSLGTGTDARSTMLEPSRLGSTLLGDAVTTFSHGPHGATPRYAAPEQLAGERIDARADEFAFAATLFEALYGAAPHGGATAQALLLAKQRGAPPMPRADVLGRRGYAALARAMSPDPSLRFGDVGAAMAAIRGEAHDAGRGGRRAGLFAVIGALAVGGWALSGPAEVCDGTRAGITAADEAAIMDAMTSDDAGRGLVDRVVSSLRAHDRAANDARAAACTAGTPEVLRCLDRVDASTRAAVDALRTIDRAPHRALAIVEALTDPRACARPDADPVVVGPPLDPDDASARTAWAQLSAARFAERAGDARGALDLVDGLAAGDLGVLTNEVALTRGDLLHTLGRYPEAVAAFEAVFADADARGEALDAARAAVGLAFVVGAELKHVDEGLSWVRHGEAQLRRVTVPSGVAADLANAKGAILFMSGRHAPARAEFERALEQGDGGSPSRARAIRQNLAIMKVLAGDPDAVDALAAVHDELARDLGREHASTVQALANLGNAMARSGRLAEGRAMLETALELREAAVGTDTVENARILCQLAELDVQDGDPSAALAHLRAATDLRERWLPEGHPDLADGVLQLAELLIESGDLDGAERLLDRHVDAFTAAFAPEHSITADFAHARGIVALHRGRADEAARLLGAAVRGAAALGDDGDQLPIWRVDAARAELARGDLDAARLHVASIGARVADLPPEVRVELDAVRTALGS